MAMDIDVGSQSVSGAPVDASQAGLTFIRTYRGKTALFIKDYILCRTNLSTDATTCAFLVDGKGNVLATIIGVDSNHLS